MTKPVNTQNESLILTLNGAMAGFCLVSLDVKEKYTNQSHESILRFFLFSLMTKPLNTQN